MKTHKDSVTLSPFSQMNEKWTPLKYENAPTLIDDRKKRAERKKVFDKAKEDGII